MKMIFRYSLSNISWFSLAFFVISLFVDPSGDMILFASNIASTLSYGGNWLSGPRAISSTAGFIFFLSVLLLFLNQFYLVTKERLPSRVFSYAILYLVIAFLLSFFVSLIRINQVTSPILLELISIPLPYLGIYFYQNQIFSCVSLQEMQKVVAIVICIVFLKYLFSVILSPGSEVVIKGSFLTVYLSVIGLLDIRIFKSPLYYLLGFCFPFALLIQTGQRGYFVAFVICLLYIVFANLFRLRFPLFASLTAIIVILIASFVLLFYSSYSANLFSDVGTEYRLEQLVSLASSIRQFPIFGLGLGQPPVDWNSFLAGFRVFQMELDLPYLLTKFGFISSLFFLASIISALLTASKTRKKILTSRSETLFKYYGFNFILDRVGLYPDVLLISCLGISLFQTCISSLVINTFIAFIFLYQQALLHNEHH